MALGRIRAYAAWMRYGDILALQGAPLLGAVFAMGQATVARVGGLLVLALANLLLVAHIFVINDWAGVDADLNDSNKRADVFAARGLSRRGIRRLWVGLLAASLGLFVLLGPRPLLFAVAIFILSALYSRPRSPLKGVPILSSMLHLGGGMLHFLLGVSLFGEVDWPAIGFAVFCGLTFAAGHLNQEVRDFAGDRDNRITTNAVAFGKRRTFVAGLALFTAAYAQLLVLAEIGVIPRWLAFLGCLFPLHVYWSWRAWAEDLSFEGICRLQARYRVLFAVVGATILSSLLVSATRGIVCIALGTP
jgi:4-hydroxybenzoate polyprenyltransferase